MAGRAGSDSELVAQLRELHAALTASELAYCLIGGVAVNAYGRVRGTLDLDLMIYSEAASQAQQIVESLGFRSLAPGDDIASYVRGNTRLDFLIARRPIARDLLARAGTIEFGGDAIPVIPIEGLLGLKIQAFNDNPSRLQDLDDIVQLVRLHRDRLNLDELRRYFRLFDRESVLDDILRSTRDAGTDRS